MKSDEKHIKTPNGFQIPDNYFEDFRINFDSRLPNQTVKPSVFKSFYKWTAIAASFVILSISGFVFWNNNSSDNSLEKENYALSEIEYLDIEIDDIYFAYSDLSSENVEDEQAKAFYIYEAIDLYDLPYYEP